METSKNFKIKSDFMPSGDQPEAIKKLSEGLSKNELPLGVQFIGNYFQEKKLLQVKHLMIND